MRNSVMFKVVDYMIGWRKQTTEIGYYRVRLWNFRTLHSFQLENQQYKMRSNEGNFLGLF